MTKPKDATPAEEAGAAATIDAGREIAGETAFDAAEAARLYGADHPNDVDPHRAPKGGPALEVDAADLIAAAREVKAPEPEAPEPLGDDDDREPWAPTILARDPALLEAAPEADPDPE